MEQNYYSLSEFLKNKFGKKTVKLSIDGGFTCPNRDGTLSSKGCIFCSEKGSGDFAGNRNESISKQIENQKKLISKKWNDNYYIAYFQAFTNTYADVDVLKNKYNEALSQPDIKGLAIATRPDCLNKEIAEIIYDISKNTYVWVELGLQTSNENTAKFINRGYTNTIFENAVKLLKSYNIDVVCHIILGICGETKSDMLNSVKYACSQNIDGIKIQMLNIIEGTELAEIYKKEPFPLLSFEEYTSLVANIIGYIPKNIVIHRLTGDGDKNIVIEPKWIFKKRAVLNTILKNMRENGITQGIYL